MPRNVSIKKPNNVIADSMLTPLLSRNVLLNSKHMTPNNNKPNVY